LIASIESRDVDRHEQPKRLMSNRVQSLARQA
jgi:hypothetical protein